MHPRPPHAAGATLDRWPGLLDLIQSGSGLLLALFMWAHMFLVSSILISEAAMYRVARMFEGEPLLGEPWPGLVSLAVAGVSLLLGLHALLALRRFPSSYRQQRRLLGHMAALRHGDTTLWFVQVLTGLALMFLAPVHLYQMLVHPADIGPFASADRVWSGRMWPLYLLLLFAVELHGGIGLYRIAVKWGWFAGADPRRSRRRLKVFKWSITIFLLSLGLLTLAAYMKLGYDHRHAVGERWHPAQTDAVPAADVTEQPGESR